jgi:hypothetical protein
MELSDLEYPPLSPGSPMASLDEWFAITREDLPRVVAESDSDSGSDFQVVGAEFDDGDFVLVGAESNSESDDAALPPTSGDMETLAAADEAAPIGIAIPPFGTAALPISRPGTPQPASPPTPTPPRVILINDRKTTAPGFNTHAVLTWDDRWISRDVKYTRRTHMWYSCGCCASLEPQDVDLYPLEDPVYHRRYRDIPRVPTETRSAPSPDPSFMRVRVVDASEELTYRLAREAVRAPLAVRKPPVRRGRRRARS